MPGATVAGGASVLHTAAASGSVRMLRWLFDNGFHACALPPRNSDAQEVFLGPRNVCYRKYYGKYFICPDNILGVGTARRWALDASKRDPLQVSPGRVCHIKCPSPLNVLKSTQYHNCY